MRPGGQQRLRIQSAWLRMSELVFETPLQAGKSAYGVLLASAEAQKSPRAVDTTSSPLRFFLQFIIKDQYDINNLSFQNSFEFEDWANDWVKELLQCPFIQPPPFKHARMSILVPPTCKKRQKAKSPPAATEEATFWAASATHCGCRVRRVELMSKRPTPTVFLLLAYASPRQSDQASKGRRLDHPEHAPCFESTRSWMLLFDDRDKKSKSKPRRFAADLLRKAPVLKGCNSRTRTTREDETRTPNPHDFETRTPKPPRKPVSPLCFRIVVDPGSSAPAILLCLYTRGRRRRGGKSFGRQLLTGRNRAAPRIATAAASQLRQLKDRHRPFIQLFHNLNSEPVRRGRFQRRRNASSPSPPKKIGCAEERAPSPPLPHHFSPSWSHRQVSGSPEAAHHIVIIQTLESEIHPLKEEKKEEHDSEMPKEQADDEGEGLLQYRREDVQRWGVRLDEELEPADYDRARKYWDLYTLPRFTVDASGDVTRCEPGVYGNPYHVYHTHVDDLRDFGIGVAMYFRTLLYICGACVAIGLATIPVIRYFQSDTYGAQQEDMDWSVRGSAACERETICLDAACDDTAIAAVCPFDKILAWTDFAAFLALVIGLLLLTLKQNRLATQLDEAEQTAQDYSIRVEDPSPEATDPDVWRKYFEHFGPVRFVTVTRRNGTLLELLSQRRAIRQQLDFNRGDLDNLEEGHVFAPATGLKALLQTLGFQRDFAFWALQMAQKDREIREELARPELSEAAKVYVTFDTENAQRRCLKALTDGAINTTLDQNVTGWLTGREVDEQFLWDNPDGSRNQLAVVEAPEPSDVIWKNQSVPLWLRLTEQAVGFTGCAVVVALAAVIIDVLAESGQGAAVGFFIAGANSILPALMKFFTEIESHLSFSSKQTSMLIKLVVARWMTTGVIYRIITPTEEVTSEDSLHQVYNILFADAVTTPFIRLLDIGGRLNRLLIAPGTDLPLLKNIFPGVKTQAEMNGYYAGTDWSLAERFTDLSKSLFVSLFNLALFPTGIFITAFTMLVNFWVDKYCLLRIWKPQPTLGPALAETNRTYIALCLVFHFMAALHTYAAWPFDGFADTEQPLNANGTASGVSRRDTVYEDVGDMTARGKTVFELSTREWMTEEQRNLVRVFSAVSIAMFTIFMLLYLGRGILELVRLATTGIYEEPGEVQGIRVSNLHDENAIDAYVPLIHCAGQKHPLLAAQVNIPLQHLPFKVKEDELRDINLWDEMCNPACGGVESNAQFFSVIKMYDVMGVKGKDQAPATSRV
eukprot:scaffold228_cov312-Pinguiococcus_pyrenoidosus.AAC.57